MKVKKWDHGLISAKFIYLSLYKETNFVKSKVENQNEGKREKKKFPEGDKF